MYFYVYRITHKILNKHYYGVRKSKVEPKEDLGFKYFSSSSDKEFMLEQKEFKDRFKYKVVKVFESAKESYVYEYMLLRKFNVHKNNNFYNRGIQGPGSHLISKGQDKGNVLGKDRITGKLARYTKEEFDKNDNLVGVNYGNISGRNNHNAKIIRIYDNFNNLVYTTHGNFHKFCKENSLPTNAFSKSQKNKGLVVGYSEQSRTELRKNCYQNFIGWYALLDGEFQDEQIIVFDIIEEQKIGMFCKFRRELTREEISAKNKHAKKIIMQYKDEKYCCHGTFIQFCKDKNLNLTLLRRYKGDNITINHIFFKNNISEQNKNTIGWKMIEVDEF